MFHVHYVPPSKKLSTDRRRFVGFLGHLDSCLEPCAPGERATGVGSPRLRGVGAADFRRDLAGIGRERLAGDGASGGYMKTKNLGVALEETGLDINIRPLQRQDAHQSFSNITVQNIKLRFVVV